MTADELKIAWKAYDRKLQTSQALNERIINSMITDRSRKRFSAARRHYIAGIMWMSLWLAVGVLILVTNPFDYQGAIQYIPMVIFVAGLIILTVALAARFFALQRITLTQHNIADALRQTVALYEKPRKYLHYAVIVFLFSQAILFPLSFLPQNIASMGLWPALAERLIPISIAVLLLFAAWKAGLFRERRGEQFRRDLQELSALRAMVSELGEEKERTR